MHRRVRDAGLLSLALAALLVGCGGGGRYCPPADNSTSYDTTYVPDPPTDAPTDSPTDPPSDEWTPPPDQWTAHARKPLRRVNR